MQTAGCPLWVKSGHCRMSARSPLYPPKADMALRLANRRALSLPRWRRDLGHRLNQPESVLPFRGIGQPAVLAPLSV